MTQQTDEGSLVHMIISVLQTTIDEALWKKSVTFDVSEVRLYLLGHVQRILISIGTAKIIHKFLFIDNYL